MEVAAILLFAAVAKFRLFSCFAKIFSFLFQFFLIPRLSFSSFILIFFLHFLIRFLFSYPSSSISRLSSRIPSHHHLLLLFLLLLPSLSPFPSTS